MDNGLQGKRSAYEILRAQLDNERSTFKTHWRDLSDYILPRRSRFFTTDANKGDRRNQKIIDSTATLAIRTLRSGMMGGITSPARPWFKLAVPDSSLDENENVKIWLEEVSKKMRSVFLKSNLYKVLPVMYGDLGCFGTACVFMEEDLNSTVRFYPFPIGSYSLALNEDLKVDVFFREYRMTVRQVVNNFGKNPEMPGEIDWSNISENVKRNYENNQKETWIDICHCIKPNPEYDENRLESKYKKYISVTYEKGTDNQGMSFAYQGKFLREKGYDFFPVLAPRWETTGEDVYGTDCPGMTALGDIKQLQTGEKRVLQAVDKMVNPPMTGPTSMKNSKISILPGDITFTDDRNGGQGFRPSHQVNFNVQQMEQKQDQVRRRISRSFFEDLFLMLANSDRRQITAREVEERHEEKLLALGPVLEQLNDDVLDPLIDNTFAMMLRQGLIPPAPQELQGVELKVEYISIMAQAQKLVGLGGIERFTEYVGGVASIDPSVLDKVDKDQLVDIYGDLTSIPTGVVRSDEDAEAIRQARAESQRAQEQAEKEQMRAQTAQTLSQTDTSGENALTDLANVAGAGQMVDV